MTPRYYADLRNMTTITLQLPQNIYESLQKAAARAGQTPEDLITQLLGQTVQTFADDPLEEFIGAFHSDIPDWGENHDRYLGQGIMENHNA